MTVSTTPLEEGEERAHHVDSLLELGEAILSSLRTHSDPISVADLNRLHHDNVRTVQANATSKLQKTGSRGDSLVSVKLENSVPSYDKVPAEAGRVNTRILLKLYIWVAIPLLIAAFMCYVDRTNLSYASLQMNEDLGLSEMVYGIGAGIFFVTYITCGVPLTLFVEKLGTRGGLTIVMFLWGISSFLMSVTIDQYTFLLFRLILGATEAGFFPAVLAHFTSFFPDAQLGTAWSVLISATSFSAFLGSGVAGAVFEYTDGFGGWPAWRWLFVVEGLPTMFLAGVLYLVLDDNVETARFLSVEERKALLVALGRWTEKNTTGLVGVITPSPVISAARTISSEPLSYLDLDLVGFTPSDSAVQDGQSASFCTNDKGGECIDMTVSKQEQKELEANSSRRRWMSLVRTALRFAFAFKTLVFCAIHFLGLTAYNALLFFTPIIIYSLMSDDSGRSSAALLSSVPSLTGAVSMVAVGYIADHSRAWLRFHLCWSALVAASGFFLLSIQSFVVTSSVVWTVASLSLVNCGLAAQVAPFASLLVDSLSEDEQGASSKPEGGKAHIGSKFSYVNSVGMLSGVFAPPFFSLIHSAFNSYDSAFLLLGVLLTVSAFLPFLIRSKSVAETSP